MGGHKVLVKAYEDASPENMRALVEIMTYDKARFAWPEPTRARSRTALARPDHLRNYAEVLAHGAPIPVKVDRDTMPMMLIHGMHDRVLHYETSLWLLANNPDARPVLPSLSGHGAMIERAAECNRLVIDFLSHS
ncbi:alpha/beta fold hydrolase [Streptomyces minutiscleroticus]|uniref:alpha/beta fold hydrolase n=1 Tax=Streptomyces minutiscleroticus TaxID=68238 RepID=UPI00332E0DD5